jgi:hypothetical protein
LSTVDTRPVIANDELVALVKYDDDDAKRPLCAQIGELVAAVMTPKLLAKVKAFAAPVEV